MTSSAVTLKFLLSRLGPVKRCTRVLIWMVTLCLVSISGHAQIPLFNTGSNTASSMLDFAQMYLDEQKTNAKKAAQQKQQTQELIASGAISTLDLNAPPKAVHEFNRAVSLLKAQNAKEAISYLQKAIGAYPRFVSAHVSLGLAYFDQNDAAHAESEFETAAKLDDKFPRSFLNLGILAMARKDFATAQSRLQKAASLRPKDPNILFTLAYAQYEGQEYQHALETAQRVHALDHKGVANVHYVAAAAAGALNDFETMQRELSTFLSEDPTNALAPVAHHDLEILARNKNSTEQPVGAAGLQQPVQRHETFPNSERLKAQLSALGDESEGGACEKCRAPDPTPADGNNGGSLDTPLDSSSRLGPWTIRKVVDEVALFFAVSSHGQMVSDLAPSDIQIRDNNKPPERLLQFTPQSKLPLRLGLVVDTSGSVQDRFSFEKRAATKFVQKLLNRASDLGFVVGFASELTVTRDFTAETSKLGTGIEKLTNRGGTRLFDAVSMACGKLSAYPEHERVARVLVVLSDGEDNSSHKSLKQALQDAEATGVTIYTVSTKEDAGNKTDADKILQALAERSGGEAIFPGDMLTLGKSLDRLSELIRSRYLIAYKPSNFMPDGSYHVVRIIAQKNGKRLQVHARKGYYARFERNPN